MERVKYREGRIDKVLYIYRERVQHVERISKD